MEVSTMSEFNFDSTCTSPTFISAPTSPHRFFYSVPTSPYRSSVPFTWEHKPGTPKLSTATSSNYGDAEQQDLEEIDFAFDFSGHFDDTSSLPADELFDGGKIRPLKPPPKHQYYQQHTNIKKKTEIDSPKSPNKRFSFSPRNRNANDFDPFAVAIEETRKQSIIDEFREKRGREKAKSRSRNKGTARSLSPLRVSDLLFDEPEPAKVSTDSSSSSSLSGWYKKWKIKDLLLFRSASEGRATDSLLRKREVKNSSFRSNGSMSRKGPVSAHELHYTINRAVSEEMKKRTSLPYKHGLLGCLGFQSSISRGVGSCASSMARR